MLIFRPTRNIRRRALVAGGLLLAGVGIGGCSLTPAPPPAPVVAPGGQVNAARARSLERALGGINADTVRNWVNRYTAPKGQAPAAAPKPRSVYIDVDALARRHAAWELADALQTGALSPTPARQVKVKVGPLAKSAKANTSANARRAAAPLPAPAALPVRAGTVVTATEPNDAAQRASRAVLDDFLADLRSRQIALEGAQDELARRALEDRIRAATRGAVEAIQLTPVSPETALELSNLRLELLDQLRVPAAQQVAATARIEAIEARLNEIWSAQTAEQTARLRAALEELPTRLRREGLATLNEAAARRQNERVAASAELRRIVAARLRGAAPASDTQILRLFLPPARVASASSLRSSADLFQTRGQSGASASVRNDAMISDARALGRPAQFNGNIAGLRAQARRDARQWARNLALSWGAQLGKPGAPDRTPQAVAALFGGRS